MEKTKNKGARRKKNIDQHQRHENIFPIHMSFVFHGKERKGKEGKMKLMRAKVSWLSNVRDN